MRIRVALNLHRSVLYMHDQAQRTREHYSKHVTQSAPGGNKDSPQTKVAPPTSKKAYFLEAITARSKRRRTEFKEKDSFLARTVCFRFERTLSDHNIPPEIEPRLPSPILRALFLFYITALKGESWSQLQQQNA